MLEGGLGLDQQQTGLTRMFQRFARLAECERVLFVDSSG